MPADDRAAIATDTRAAIAAVQTQEAPMVLLASEFDQSRFLRGEDYGERDKKFVEAHAAAAAGGDDDGGYHGSGKSRRYRG